MVATPATVMPLLHPEFQHFNPFQVRVGPLRDDHHIAVIQSLVDGWIANIRLAANIVLNVTDIEGHFVIAIGTDLTNVR